MSRVLAQGACEMARRAKQVVDQREPLLLGRLVREPGGDYRGHHAEVIAGRERGCRGDLGALSTFTNCDNRHNARYTFLLRWLLVQTNLGDLSWHL